MKHCPWCGDNVIRTLQTETAPRIFVAVCKTCGAKGPPSNPHKTLSFTGAKQSAIHLWNERHD